MRPPNSKETVENAGQAVAAATLPVRERPAKRPPCNQKKEMALGMGWWSVQQSFAERRSAGSDETSSQGYGSAGSGSYNKKEER